jgi:hypothetical protein
LKKGREKEGQRGRHRYCTQDLTPESGHHEDCERETGERASVGGDAIKGDGGDCAIEIADQSSLTSPDCFKVHQRLISSIGCHTGVEGLGIALQWGWFKSQYFCRLRFGMFRALRARVHGTQLTTISFTPVAMMIPTTMLTRRVTRKIPRATCTVKHPTATIIRNQRDRQRL